MSDSIFEVGRKVAVSKVIEVYRFLRDEVGTQFVQFIPIVERINERGEIGFQEGSQVSERSVKPEQWGTFLITIFGECPKNRFIETPDGESGLNYLCAGYKTFFTHIDKPMRIMAELLRRDRAPAEVKLVLEAEEVQLKKAFSEAGRNEPCPCGSGRKFKQCHGR